jgi:hypothetical protein
MPRQRRHFSPEQKVALLRLHLLEKKRTRPANHVLNGLITLVVCPSPGRITDVRAARPHRTPGQPTPR